MKILYVTTIGSTMGFFDSLIKILLADGHTVDMATNVSISKIPERCNGLGCKVYNIDCSRNPLSKSNLKVTKQLKSLVQDGDYDIVHCHTPIAAALTRLACRKLRKDGLKVFYTAHGFHFYKGAPFKNWLIYYPIEKICSYMTDVLITINREDYARACKKMKAKKVEYVPGVGIDVEKFRDFDFEDCERNEFRSELGIPSDAKLLVSVGELNENKNHQVVLKAVSLLEDKNIHYAIAGEGESAEQLKNLAKELGISDRFHLLGYRNDVEKLYKEADICCLPSFREGLPVAVIEGMASGLPIVVADNRGTRDLCENGVNGFICNPSSPEEFATAITKILSDNALKEKMIQTNIKKAEDFNVKSINDIMLKIYGIV